MINSEEKHTVEIISKNDTYSSKVLEYLGGWGEGNNVGAFNRPDGNGSYTVILKDALPAVEYQTSIIAGKPMGIITQIAEVSAHPHSTPGDMRG